MSSTGYSHLTFTELEIHLQVTESKLSAATAIGADRDKLQATIALLKEEIDNRREHLLK